MYEDEEILEYSDELYESFNIVFKPVLKEELELRLDSEGNIIIGGLK